MQQSGDYTMLSPHTILLAIHSYIAVHLDLLIQLATYKELISIAQIVQSLYHKINSNVVLCKYSK